MLDIDHFKSINDTYGHDVGDKVLINVARSLVQNIREVDIVGRWGGEEFIILVQEDIVGASILAEKLRIKIMEQCYEANVKVTASFGLAQYFNGEPIDSLVRRADQGLYKAKNNGRNKVEYGPYFSVIEMS